MTKRKAKRELHQFTVPMRLEFNVHVLVEAHDAEEATAKADARDYIEDGINAGECINWEVTGKPSNAD